MIEQLESCLSEFKFSELYSGIALEITKFAVGNAYKGLKAPRAKAVDAFVLGYYLPWLIYAKGLNESVFSENREMLFEKFTLEYYVFEASTELQLEIDRDYVYNIKSNPLVEKWSISKKILKVGIKGNEFAAFNLGISLSESILTFDDSESRNESINEAKDWAQQIGLDDEADRFFRTLQSRRDNKSRFKELVENFALYFIRNHQ